MTKTATNEDDMGLGINPKVKKARVVHNWTREELIEYQKCMNDPVYFCKNYIKVINLDRGLVPFELYPYQEKMMNQFKDNRFNIVLACRQSGKSLSVISFLLWYVCFHPEKTVAVLANRGQTSKEMLRRFTLMLENLPFFLQPGTKILNKSSIEFANNSVIFSDSTSSNSLRGMACNLIYLDEFAFVENDTEFYTSTYPVISSGKDTKVIITSTANGIGNMFYELWQGAQQGSNEFKPLRVDWWDVPGRDEEWKKQTIANTSEQQFNQEFGNTFYGTGDTLIDSQTLMRLKSRDPIKIDGSMKIYEEPQKNHKYVACVDVAHGGGGDYSVINIIDITNSPFKQVAVFRSNNIPPMLFPTEIHKWAKIYNESLVLVENNDQGSIVAHGLYHDIEYENLFVESAIKANGIGLNMTKKSKSVGCSNLKEILEAGRLEVVDRDTIYELSVFVAKGNSFEARQGNHDDTAMTLVSFGFFTSTDQFLEMTDLNIRQYLYEKKIKEIEENIAPIGIIGGDDTYDEELEVDKRIWHIAGIDRYF